MKTILAALLLCALPLATQAAEVARFNSFDYTGNDATAAAPLPAGQYQNPILGGFYSDPSMVRVDDDYYLVSSTFCWFPGIPVFHSRDLVHWTQIGNAIDRPGMLNFDRLGLSRGVFAPDISWHDGTFYILNTCVDCGGNYIITAKNPSGPWSDPVWLKGVGGIDTSLFVDQDGSAWLLNNDAPEGKPLYDGHRAIWIRKFDLATLKTSGPAHVLVNGGVDISTKPVWAEGPHLFQRGGHTYLMTAEGGTAINHSEVIYVGERPDGPFTPYPKPILTQRDLGERPDPVTSAGHASLVETGNGEWWAVFLATRPYSGDLYNTGRETFLLPVHWENDWPIILPPQTPVPYRQIVPNLPADSAPIPLSGNFTLHEDFKGAALPLYWMTPRVPQAAWNATGWYKTGAGLELTARPQKLGDIAQPSFIARRQQHLNMTASTRVHFAAAHQGDKAGLAAYQNEARYYFIGLVNDGGKRLIRVERRAGEVDSVDGLVLASVPLSGAQPVRLRIDARGGRYDFSYATGGVWKTLLADADGTILSTAKAGGFVGTMIGMYAHSGGP